MGLIYVNEICSVAAIPMVGRSADDIRFGDCSGGNVRRTVRGDVCGSVSCGGVGGESWRRSPSDVSQGAQAPQLFGTELRSHGLVAGQLCGAGSELPRFQSLSQGLDMRSRSIGFDDI